MRDAIVEVFIFLLENKICLSRDFSSSSSSYHGILRLIPVFFEEEISFVISSYYKINNRN